MCRPTTLHPVRRSHRQTRRNLSHGQVRLIGQQLNRVQCHQTSRLIHRRRLRRSQQEPRHSRPVPMRRSSQAITVLMPLRSTKMQRKLSAKASAQPSHAMMHARYGVVARCVNSIPMLKTIRASVCSMQHAIKRSFTTARNVPALQRHGRCAGLQHHRSLACRVRHQQQVRRQTNQRRIQLAHLLCHQLKRRQCPRRCPRPRLKHLIQRCNRRLHRRQHQRCHQQKETG